MQWTYHITAAAQPRVLARLLQLFDQQSLDLNSLIFTRAGATLAIQLTAEIEPALAHRLHAKLYNLLDVEQVRLEPNRPPPFIANS
jgi:acetolactate synthase regulatory subunit